MPLQRYRTGAGDAGTAKPGRIRVPAGQVSGHIAAILRSCGDPFRHRHADPRGRADRRLR
jgi:hypothetical protein